MNIIKNDIKNRIKRKIALSLPEALITLLIISITAAASIPVFFKKFEKKENVSHGIWECKLGPSGHVVTTWRRDGTLTSGPDAAGAFCLFKPPVTAKDFNVDICGSGMSTGCRFEDGTHVVMVYPTLNQNIKVTLTGKVIQFGDIAYAYGASVGARVIVVY